MVSGFRARRSGGGRKGGGSSTSRGRSRRSRTTAKRTASKRRKGAPVTDAGERNAAFLTATVLGLTLFGLVMVLSASSVSSLYQYADSPFFQFKRQLIWAGIGAAPVIASSTAFVTMLRSRSA